MSWKRGQQKSEETRKKMSLAKKGRSLSLAHRLSYSLGRKGKRYPEHSMRMACRLFSDEHKHKISIAKKGKPRGGVTRGVTIGERAWCGHCGIKQDWHRMRCDECGNRIRHTLRTKTAKQRREAEITRY
jgi:hypothetical protein